jgi:hypothetical protein
MKKCVHGLTGAVNVGGCGGHGLQLRANQYERCKNETAPVATVLYPEDRGSGFLPDVGKFVPVYMAAHPKG